MRRLSLTARVCLWIGLAFASLDVVFGGSQPLDRFAAVFLVWSAVCYFGVEAYLWAVRRQRR